MTETILIVEDEQDLVEILEYNLGREGYVTRSALDGATALAELEQKPLPDLVLLDLMLPDINGTEICKRIRADESTRDIPVLMLTAKGEEIDRVVGFEVGADDYLVKPFSVRELLLRIKAILRRAGPETMGATPARQQDHPLGRQHKGMGQVAQKAQDVRRGVDPAPGPRDGSMRDEVLAA